MIRHLLAGAAVALVPVAGHAADLPARKPAPAPVAATSFNWTGFYVGGQVGWVGSNLSLSDQEGVYGVYVPVIQISQPTLRGSQTLHSLLVGGFAGYNHQMGQIVVGVEGDINARFGSETSVLGTIPQITWKSESNWDASLRLRLGFLATDRTLLYVTGGVAWAHYKLGLDFEGSSMTDSKVRTGWTIGGGVQHALTNRISVRAEYRYSDYGTKTNYDSGKGWNLSHRAKITDNRVTVGLAYGF